MYEQFTRQFNNIIVRRPLNKFLRRKDLWNNEMLFKGKGERIKIWLFKIIMDIHLISIVNCEITDQF